jgi:hypothetical protein
MRRAWLSVLSGSAVLLLAAVPALGQSANPPAQPGVGPAPVRGRHLQLLVNGAVKRTWTYEELRQLATDTWRGRGAKTRPAVALTRLLEMANVSPESIKEIQFSGRKTVVLSGEKLAKLDQLVLRTGTSGGGAWGLITAVRPTEPEDQIYKLPAAANRGGDGDRFAVGPGVTARRRSRGGPTGGLR